MKGSSDASQPFKETEAVRWFSPPVILWRVTNASGDEAAWIIILRDEGPQIRTAVADTLGIRISLTVLWSRSHSCCKLSRGALDERIKNSTKLRGGSWPFCQKWVQVQAHSSGVTSALLLHLFSFDFKFSLNRQRRLTQYRLPRQQVVLQEMMTSAD